MRVVLDTSAISVFGRGGDKRLNQWFTSEHELVVPLVVIGELRAGFAAGNQTQANEKLLQRFLDASNVQTLTISDKTTRLYGHIFGRLKAAGTPMNTNDIWIAALTLEHDCLLLTLDSDFSRVPDLLVAKI